MKKLILPCLIATVLSSTAAWADQTVTSQKANKPFTMGVVVKVGGIPWFNVMEQGIKDEGKLLGVDAWQVGPTTADPAEQVRAIEDLIARKVDVIGVVPNDAKVLEPVLKRAQEAGIKVITHESPDQKNADWDFELLNTQTMGANHMKDMAKCMGEEGKYAMFVGSLTVPLVNDWANAAIAYQKEHYPNMTLVEDRFGVAESVDDSMRTTNDLMSKYKVSKDTIIGIKHGNYWKHLNLTPLQGRASEITLKDIDIIENLLNQNITIREICRQTNYSRQLIRKIKNKR